MSIRFTTVPEEANAITHSGNFHADDIFSIVFLEKILGDIVVFRSETNLLKENNFKPDAIIFDIGYGKFDHHQKDGNGYHNTNDTTKLPIPYASFGLLWKHYGKAYCDSLTNNNPQYSKYLWEYIENRLVIGIDAYDNGIYPQVPHEYATHRVFTVSSAISIMNPIDEDITNYLPFIYQALDFAQYVFSICIKEGLNKIYPSENTNHRTNTINQFTAEKVFAYALFKRLYDYSYSDIIQQFDSWKHSAIIYHSTKSSKTPIPYSKVGSIWEDGGRQYCASIAITHKYPEYIWDFIRSRIIIGIDAIANGILPFSNKEYVDYNIFTLYDFIESLNLNITSIETYNNVLMQAISLVQVIITRIECKAISHLSSRDYVEKKIIQSRNILIEKDEFYKKSSRHILVFDKHVHWQDWLYLSPDGKDIWFVISPSNTTGYIIQPVRDNNTKNGYRKGFPRKWHGLNGESLRRKTKVPTASFIHSNNGFLAGAEDLEGAIRLAEKAFSNFECERKIQKV